MTQSMFICNRLMRDFCMPPCPRPLVHALVGGHVATATGIELDRVKCAKAAAFFKLAITQLQQKGVVPVDMIMPSIKCSPIEAIVSLNPATHAYSFWEGVPYDARLAFGKLFAASSTLQAVTVVQRSMRNDDPASLMDEWYNFGSLQLVESFPVSMSGTSLCMLH
jgi:hypothetical protein